MELLAPLHLCEHSKKLKHTINRVRALVGSSRSFNLEITEPPTQLTAVMTLSFTPFDPTTS